MSVVVTEFWLSLNLYLIRKTKQKNRCDKSVSDKSYRKKVKQSKSGKYVLPDQDVRKAL